MSVCKTCSGYGYARGGLCWNCDGTGSAPSTIQTGAGDRPKLTMPNGDVLECEYPNSADWAKSWSMYRGGKIGATGEQDWEIVETYGLTAILAALPSVPAGGLGALQAEDRPSVPGQSVIDRWTDLEAAARAATDGPWSTRNGEDDYEVWASPADLKPTGDTALVADVLGYNDAAFIAAANPAAVLELIAAARASAVGILRQQNEPNLPTEDAAGGCGQ